MLSLGGIARTYIRLQRWRFGVPVPLRPLVRQQPAGDDGEQGPSGPIAIILWASTTLATFALWGWLAIHWWPREREWRRDRVADAMVFASHVVFMDLVVNWLTAVLLHRVQCLARWEHRWEHRLTKAARLSSVLLISTMYASYTMVWMLAWGVVIGCTSPSGKGCLHWESTMWAASWGYALVGLFLRLTLWSMRHRPVLYEVPLLRKMSRFYWAHFSFQEWTGGVVFGAITPFYDVILGTCPFDIRWSVPIPVVDFLVCDEHVFLRMKHPKAIKWTAWQWAWHLTWAAIVVLLLSSLVVGQAAGWFA
jgi:hypothetical protein